MEYKGLMFIDKNKELLINIMDNNEFRTIYISVKDFGDKYFFTIYFIDENDLKTLCQFSITKDEYIKSNMDYMEIIMYVFKHNGLRESNEFMIL